MVVSTLQAQALADASEQLREVTGRTAYASAPFNGPYNDPSAALANIDRAYQALLQESLRWRSY